MKNKSKSAGKRQIFKLLILITSIVTITLALSGITIADSNEISFSFNENFSDPQSANWKLSGNNASWNATPTNHSEAVLQLTGLGEYLNGSAFYNNSFNSNSGIVAEFRYYTANGTGADGFSFFLVNGSNTNKTNFHAGSSGGSLGYAGADSKLDGVPNSYIGVGFDENGNFDETDFIGSQGGEHEVAIRGTQGSNYTLLTSVNLADSFGKEVDGGWRRARVTVDSSSGEDSIITVEISWDGGTKWEQVINTNYSTLPPSELKLGFSGSTGAATNRHDIDWLKVKQPVNLTITNINTEGTAKTGEQFNYTVDVINNGPNNDSSVTVKDGSDNLTGISPKTISLNSGETKTVTFNGTVKDNASNLIINVSTSPSSGFIDPSPTDATINHSIGVEDILAPTADAGDNFSSLANNSVEFNASGSVDNVEIVSYTWDFGDGFSGFGITSNHTYNTTGTYNVSLNVTDSNGNNDIDNVTVTIPSFGGVRTAKNNGNYYLGSDFIEIGVLSNGGFGADVTTPASFFGNERGEIGLYADVDGFYNDTYSYRYDYFLPGSSEERWSVGFERNDTQNRGFNGRVAGTNIPTTVNKITTSKKGKLAVNSTFENDLIINQTYELKPRNRFIKVNISLINDGSFKMENIRYQRSFDPDNGVDVNCDYDTNNTIVNQQGTSNKAVVKAELKDSDINNTDIGSISSIPIFYYTQSKDARVSIGNNDFGLEPSNPPYGDRDWNSAPEEGTSIEADSYIAVTFNKSNLEPGESVNYTYYIGLTKNITTTISDVEEDAGGVPVSISNLSVTNPSKQNVLISLETDEKLQTLDISIGGAESATMLLSDFTEIIRNGSYIYKSNYKGSSNGNYLVTVKKATGSNGKDGANGESDNVIIDFKKPASKVDDSGIIHLGQSLPDGNVRSTDSKQKVVSAGKSTRYGFSEGSSSVKGISFNSKENIGRVIASVQTLDTLPEDVKSPGETDDSGKADESEKSESKTYSTMSITVGNEGTVSEDNADNILIEFEVTKEWVEDNNIDTSTIRMQRYHNGDWNDLPTNKVAEDGKLLHFTAFTPGFSIFTVVGDKIEDTGTGDDKTESDTTVNDISGRQKPETETESDKSIPGFTSILTLGVLGVIYLVLKRR